MYNILASSTRKYPVVYFMYQFENLYARRGCHMQKPHCIIPLRVYTRSLPHTRVIIHVHTAALTLKQQEAKFLFVAVHDNEFCPMFLRGRRRQEHIKLRQSHDKP